MGRWILGLMASLVLALPAEAGRGRSTEVQALLRNPGEVLNLTVEDGNANRMWGASRQFGPISFDITNPAAPVQRMVSVDVPGAGVVDVREGGEGVACRAGGLIYRFSLRDSVTGEIAVQETTVGPDSQVLDCGQTTSSVDVYVRRSLSGVSRLEKWRPQGFELVLRAPGAVTGQGTQIHVRRGVPEYVIVQTITGFEVYSNANTPALLASVTGLTAVTATAFRHPFLYVAEGAPNNQLRVFDLTTHTAPVARGIVAGGIPAQQRGLKVSAAGDRVYGFTGGIVRVYDVTNPDAPVLLVSDTSPANTVSIHGVGDQLLLGRDSFTPGTAGLSTYDASASPIVLQNRIPAGPFARAGDADLLAGFKGVAVSNTLGGTALTIYDVADPNNISVLGTGAAGLNQPIDAVVIGNNAYVLDAVPGNPATVVFHVIDISNPAALVSVFNTSLGAAGGRWIAKAPGRNLVMFAVGNDVRVYDVAAPNQQNPQLLSTTSVGSGMLSGKGKVGWGPTTDINPTNFLFIAAGAFGMHVLDITNPAAPAATTLTSPGFTPQGLDVRPGDSAVDPRFPARLMAVSSQLIWVVDVTNPMAPVLRLTHNVSGRNHTDVVGLSSAIWYAADDADSGRLFCYRYDHNSNTMAECFAGGFKLPGPFTGVRRAQSVSNNWAFFTGRYGVATVNLD